MAQRLQVPKSGYDAWRRRSKSFRKPENKALLKEIVQIHEASHSTCGSKKISHEINRRPDKPASHKRAERIMHKNGIRSTPRRTYKATTNSGHSLPAAENILNRNFIADRPGHFKYRRFFNIPLQKE